MISDREVNTIYFSERLKIDPRFTEASNRIFSKLDSLGAKYIFLPNTKDIWARDYMPIQVNETRFIEFRYDPDYLQGTGKDRREIKTYPDIVCDSIGLKTKKTDIILDGGNVVKSEDSIILTDKIVWENKKHYSEKQLLNSLHELFEVDKVVLIPWDKECIYGHADGMLRFINTDTVLISGFYETTDENLKKLILSSLEKAGLGWEWLRVSENEVEDNIAYINFLQTKDLIIVPALNKTEDNEAIKQISLHFQDYAKNNRIAKVDITEIVRFEGALNCITWTIKN